MRDSPMPTLTKVAVKTGWNDGAATDCGSTLPGCKVRKSCFFKFIMIMTQMQDDLPYFYQKIMLAAKRSQTHHLKSRFIGRWPISWQKYEVWSIKYEPIAMRTATQALTGSSLLWGNVITQSSHTWYSSFMHGLSTHDAASVRDCFVLYGT